MVSNLTQNLFLLMVCWLFLAPVCIISVLLGGKAIDVASLFLKSVISPLSNFKNSFHLKLNSFFVLIDLYAYFFYMLIFSILFHVNFLVPLEQYVIILKLVALLLLDSNIITVSVYTLYILSDVLQC